MSATRSRVLRGRRRRGYGARASGSWAQAGRTVFASMRDPQGRVVADEIVRVIGLPAGRRPSRTVADGSGCGAEIINGAAEGFRLRPARRTGITGLLHRA